MISHMSNSVIVDVTFNAALSRPALQIYQVIQPMPTEEAFDVLREDRKHFSAYSDGPLYRLRPATCADPLERYSTNGQAESNQRPCERQEKKRFSTKKLAVLRCTTTGAESKNVPRAAPSLVLTNSSYLPGTPWGTPKLASGRPEFAASHHGQRGRRIGLSRLRHAAPTLPIMGVVERAAILSRPPLTSTHTTRQAQPSSSYRRFTRTMPTATQASAKTSEIVSGSRRNATPAPSANTGTKDNAMTSKETTTSSSPGSE